MLRIHFTPADLTRVRLHTEPDPLWEVVCSLHRLQTTQGRRAHAGWHRATRRALAGTPLGKAVHQVLFPVLPRAAYFPDFLTPYEAVDGLGRGLAAVVDTPPERIAHETRTLRRVTGAPSWVARLTERPRREELAAVLRAYHEAVVAPYHDRMCASVAGEWAVRARLALGVGVDGLLGDLSPTARWRPPVLEVDYVTDRDLHLQGRGLRVIPSYFCWRTPITLVDGALPPVLVYPLQHGAPSRGEVAATASAPLAALLGRTRAAVLRGLTAGATTSELARALGVSPATATHHTTVLRNAGLITTRRAHNAVLHTLTPTGAALLSSGTPRSGA
ncbi:ArsR/SmtB family transcription factor [Streptomyces roseolus]|uniref:ArsR/SmtB family transcription factor n=1 Tax=Streptomyces roseolus TaxID=67358 RepID=UPI0016721E4F|nr:winged helix-turn-helix domain-containing protein [Streptomyces roseolus]GGR66073.1 transcriptional regulator [Streptomyces roseolus]